MERGIMVLMRRRNLRGITLSSYTSPAIDDVSLGCDRPRYHAMPPFSFVHALPMIPSAPAIPACTTNTMADSRSMA